MVYSLEIDYYLAHPYFSGVLSWYSLKQSRQILDEASVVTNQRRQDRQRSLHRLVIITKQFVFNHLKSQSTISQRIYHSQG